MAACRRVLLDPAFERGTISIFSNILPLLSEAIMEEKLLSANQWKRAEEYQSEQGVQWDAKKTKWGSGERKQAEKIDDIVGKKLH